MYSDHKNYFRYTTESILDSQGGAIVIPVNSFGEEVVYPYIDHHRATKISKYTFVNEWRNRSEFLEVCQTYAVKNNQRSDELNFDWIIYTVVPSFDNKDNWFLLCDCYRKCINTAAENGITEIAFPYMGYNGLTNRSMTDLIFYIRNVLNETIYNSGGPEKMNVSVQLPITLFRVLIILDNIMSGKASSTMSLHEAYEWAHQYKAYINNDQTIKNLFRMIPFPRPENEKKQYDISGFVNAYIERSKYIGDLIRENQRAVRIKNMIARIKQEKDSFITRAVEKKPYEDIKDIVRRFRCGKIDDIIQKWCDIPVTKEKRVKYERKTNNRKKLADIIGISSQYLTDLSKARKFPSRDMMLALAAGMKLSYEERIELMMYHDDDRNYPSTETEKLVEKCLEESGYADSDMPFLTFNNDYIYERSGHRYSLYKGGERTEKAKRNKDSNSKEANNDL